MIIVVSLLKTLGVWAICVLPGAWLGQLFITKGIVRDKFQLISFVLMASTFVLLGRTSNEFPDAWWYYVFSTMIAFLAAHRYDIPNILHWRRRYLGEMAPKKVEPSEHQKRIMRQQRAKNREIRHLPWRIKALLIFVILIIIVLILSIVALAIQIWEGGFQWK